MMKPVRGISFFYRFMTLRKVIVRSTEYAQPILLMQGILVDGLLWVGKQWGRAVLPIDGKTHAVPLPTTVSKPCVAVVSMLTQDIPDIVLSPYWTNADDNNIYITTDYEIGHSYAGTGENIVAWVLISG